MKNLKNIFTILCLSVIFVSCGQNKKSNKQMKNRPLKQMYANAEKLDYKSMPNYYIEGYQSGCFYELYINGIMVFSHFENVGLSNHATNINQNILKSGSQKVTIKLFPLGEIDGKNFSTIDPDDSFRLKIFSRDKNKSYKAFDYDFLKEHEVKIPTSVPYFEETITFNAEVPYELEGWSNSQNLKEMDQEILKREVISFYKNYAEIINNQDEEAWVKLVEKREKEYFKSVFYNDVKSKELEPRIKNFSTAFDSKFKEKFPLENFSLNFGENGKIVVLMSLYERGYSPLYYGIEEIENGQSFKFKEYEFLFLHKPKGSNKLEIIR